MKKIVLIILSSLLFLGILAGCGQSSNQNQSSDDQIQTIQIVADDWSFTPDSITVKPGKVKFVIENKAKRMHGFAIDELGIKESLAPGKTIEKIVDVKEAGQYTFYCSVVCGDLEQHGGMKGTLTVQ
ncbi:MAG: cupredoxin domain-containing protein [Tepidibacillus sp.]